MGEVMELYSANILEQIIPLSGWLAIAMQSASIYKGIRLTKLTRGSTLAWIFAAASIMQITRSFLVAVEGQSPFLIYERMINPLIISILLYVFISKLVRIYEQDLKLLKIGLAVESAALGILQIDSKGIIRYANRAVIRMIGADRAELIDQPLISVMPESFREKHLAAFSRYLTTGKRTLDWSKVDGAFLTAQKTEVPVRISLADLTIGGEKYFVGIVQRR